jgi:hypothetical protein
MDKAIQNELDGVYDMIDVLMTNGRWELLNKLFICWASMAWRTDLDILLGWATASLSGKSKIPAREMFIKTCKRLHPDVKLWKGLE